MARATRRRREDYAFELLEDRITPTTYLSDPLIQTAFNVITWHAPSQAQVSQYRELLKAPENLRSAITSLFPAPTTPAENEAFVPVAFQRILGRAPSANGLEFFNSILAQPGGAHQVIDRLLQSDEFFSLLVAAQARHREIDPRVSPDAADVYAWVLARNEMGLWARAVSTDLTGSAAGEWRWAETFAASLVKGRTIPGARLDTARLIAGSEAAHRKSIDDAYSLILDRAPTAMESSLYLNLLLGGEGEFELAAKLLTGASLPNTSASDYVHAFMAKLTPRLAPSGSEFQTFLAIYNDPTNSTLLAKNRALVNSTTFLREKVDDWFREFLHRPLGPNEFAYWNNLYSQGLTTNGATAAILEVKAQILSPDEYVTRVWDENPAGFAAPSATYRLGVAANVDGLPAVLARDIETDEWFETRLDGRVARLTPLGGLPASASPSTMRVVDLNGDGRDDVIVRDTTTARWSAHYITPAGFVTIDLGPVPFGASDFQIADITGDGRADVLGHDAASGDWIVGVATAGALRIEHWAGPVGPLVAFHLADVNGDGRSDAVYALSAAGTPTWKVAISDSTAFFERSASISRAWSGPVWVGNFLAEGAATPRDEILFWNPNLGQYELLALSGDALTAIPVGLLFSTNPNVRIADANDDGVDEILLYDTAVAAWQVGVWKSATNAYVVENWGRSFAAHAWTFETSAGMMIADTVFPYRAALEAYQFVRNTIEYQPYYGAMKGPTATRETKRGNDWDQASLLIEELAKPDRMLTARYASGQVRYSGLDTMLWLSMTSTAGVFELLTNGHIPFEYRESDITFRIDRAWTQVRLPGPVAAPRWRDVDPAMKATFTSAVASDALASVDLRSFISGIGFDLNEFLQADPDQLPIDFYLDKAQGFLTNFVEPIASKGRLSVIDVVRRQSIHPDTGTSLPSTIPGTIEGPAAIFAGVPWSQTHRLKLEVYSVVQAPWGNTPVMTFDIAVPSIGDSRITINIEVSVDRKFFDVHLRIDGVESIYRGEMSLGFLGYLTYPSDTGFRIEVQSLLGDQSKGDPIRFEYAKTDGVVAIAIDVDQYSDQSLARIRANASSAAIDLADRYPNDQSIASISDAEWDRSLGSVLHLALASYYVEFGRSIDMVADLSRSRRVFPYPGVGVSFGERATIRLGASSSGGISWANTFPLVPQNMHIDMRGFTNQLVAIEGFTPNLQELKTAWQIINAQSSVLENVIIERITNVPSISTYKGFGLANIPNVGYQLFDPSTGDPNVIANQLKSYLDYGNDLLEELLANHVRSGRTVTAARKPIAWNDWSGYVYSIFRYSQGFGSLSNIIQPINGTAIGGAALTFLEMEMIERIESSRFSSTVGDPIDVANGSVYRNDVDVSIPNVGLPLIFERTYNSSRSGDSRVGVAGQSVGLGDGWLHTYSDRVEKVNDNRYIWFTAQGHRHEFILGAGGAFTNADGAFASFSTSGDFRFVRDKSGLVRRFDLSGRLIELTDRNGHGLVIDRSATDPSVILAVRDKDDSSRRLTFSYSGSWLMAIEDFTGRSWRYAYRTFGGRQYLASVTGPEGNDGAAPVYRYDYFEEGRLAGLLRAITAPDGATTSYAYYANRRAMSSTDAAGASAYVDYDPFHRRSIFVNERGLREEYRYDENGLLQEKINTDGSSERYAWSADFRMTSTTDAFGHVEQYVDYLGGTDNPTVIVDKAGRMTQYWYNAYSGLESIYRSGGRVATYQYDANGNQIASVDAYGATTAKTYYAFGTPLAGLLKSVTEPKGVPGAANDPFTTTYGYNSAGLIQSQTRGDVVIATFGYDSRGYLTSQTDATGVATTHTVDVLGRRLSSQASDPDGPIGPLGVIESTFSYDLMGRLLSQTDSNGATTRFRYDSMGRLIAKIAADGSTEIYEYDPLGGLISSTDPLGNVTRIVRDRRGNPMMTVSADDGRAYQFFDAGGAVVLMVDPNGVTDRLRIDALGRVTQRIEIVAEGNDFYTEYGYINNLDAGWNDNHGTASFAGYSGLVVAGDWNGAADGQATDTVGLFVPSTRQWRLRSDNTGGAGVTVFTFGAINPQWKPIAGDWNGDGRDTIGLFDPTTKQFQLRDSNSDGAADYSFIFDPNGSGSIPIVGDWDGDGDDTIGLYNPATGAWTLRNSNSAGPADLTFTFGPADGTWLPVVGDWNGDGVDTIGCYSPVSGQFLLRNKNAAGSIDAGVFRVFYTEGSNPNFVAVGAPLAGKWQGTDVDAVGVASTTVSGTVARLQASIDHVSDLPSVVRDPRGVYSRFTYDRLNRVTYEQYNDNNQLAPTNLAITHRFDANGNETETGRFDFVYWTGGALSPDRVRITVTAFDTFNRPQRVFDPGSSLDVNSPNASFTETIHDAAGRVLKTRDRLGNWTDFDYDNAGRLESVTLPAPTPGSARPMSRYQRDANGAMIAKVDRVSPTDPLDVVTTQFRYDSLGRLVETTFAAGTTDEAATRIVFDLAGAQILAIDELRRAAYTRRDARGRILEQWTPDPDGAGPLLPLVTKWAYDPAGNIKAIVDPGGKTIQRTYDSRNRLKTETGIDPDDGGPLPPSVVIYEYGLYSPDLYKIREVRGAVERDVIQEHDKFGRLKTVYQPDPDGSGPLKEPSVSYAYNGFSEVTVKHEFINLWPEDNGRRMYFTYDARGRVVAESLSKQTAGVLEPATLTTYDREGRPVEIKSLVTVETGVSQFRVTTNTYDALGRLIETRGVDPDGVGEQVAPRTTRAYDLVGNLLTETTTVSANAADSLVSTYEYDKRFRLKQHAAPHTPLASPDEIYWTETTFDAANQRTLIRTPGSPDSAGQPRAETTLSDYDRLGRLVKRREPSATGLDADRPTTDYVYDARGRLLRRRDPSGLETTFEYDNLGRVTRESDLFGQRQYAFDVWGNLSRRTDKDGRVIEYAYDSLDRRTEERWYDAGQLARKFVSAFDDYGRLASELDYFVSGGVSALSTSLFFTYDWLDNLTAERSVVEGGIQPVTIDSKFNLLGERTDFWTRVSAPSDPGAAGFHVTYQRDALGRLVGVSQTAEGASSQNRDKSVVLSYDAAGRRTSLARYDGLAGVNPVAATTSDFDPSGRDWLELHLDEGFATDSAEILAHSGQNYDAAGRVWRAFRLNDADILSYDARGQVSERINIGEGSFAAPIGTQAGFAPFTIASGDFDGDGDKDVAAAAALEGAVRILTNQNGALVAGPNNLFSTSGPPMGIVTGDWNNDGALDLATANAIGNVAILVNDGAGVFTLAATYSLAPLAAGDLNGDGKADLVAAEYLGGGRRIHTLLNNGAGGFTASLGVELAGNAFSLTLADMNADSKLDLIAGIPAGGTTEFAGKGGVEILFGAGDGTFSAAGAERYFSTDEAGTTAVAIGDLDFNGRLDVVSVAANQVVAQGSAPTSYAYVRLRGEGGLLAVDPADVPPRVEVGLDPTGVVLADLNRDHVLDLATANHASGTTTVWVGFGTGRFVSRSDHQVRTLLDPEETIGNAFSLAAVDLGGATEPGGLAELIIANPEDGQVVALNRASGAVERFTFGVSGNRTNSGFQSSATGDRLLTDGVFRYAYDNEGHRISRTEILPSDAPGTASGEQLRYVWDHRGRLRRVETYQGPTGAKLAELRYMYDPLDRRIQIRNDANADGTFENTERFIYDGDEIILAQRTAAGQAGALTTSYLHGPAVDEVFAEQTFSSEPGVAAGPTLWTLADQQGTARDIVFRDAAGETQIAYRQFFDTFGERTRLEDHSAGIGLAPTPRFAFTGRELDPGGLQYHHARYYDSATGTFLSPDPLGPAGGDANPYRYALNNPSTYVDRTGLSPSLPNPFDGGGTFGGQQYASTASHSAPSSSALMDLPLFSDLTFGFGSGLTVGSAFQTFGGASPAIMGLSQSPMTNLINQQVISAAGLSGPYNSDWIWKDTYSSSAAIRAPLYESTIHEGISGFVQTLADPGYLVGTLGNLALGAANTAYQVGASFVDFLGVSGDAISTSVIGLPLNYQTISSAGAYDQSRSWYDQSNERALDVGLNIGTAGGYGIYSSTKEYLTTGDVNAFQQQLGGVAITNLAAAGAIKVTQVSTQAAASSNISRQYYATGSEWYDYYAGTYGAQNVDWVSGSGRTISWPTGRPLPPDGISTKMFRVAPERKPAAQFAAELESVAGPRPPGGIAHHNQPLGLNGLDNGAINGSWQFDPSHQTGHDLINRQVNHLPYGTEIRIKPGANR